MQRDDGNLADRAVASPEDPALQDPPRSVTALLQASYWDHEFTPDRLYSFSYVLAVIWLLSAGVIAVVIGAKLPAWARPQQPETRMKARTTALWALGRVVGVFLFLYYLLAFVTVR